MTTTVAPLTPEEIAKLRAAYATAGMYEFRASRDTVLRLLDVAEDHARLVEERCRHGWRGSVPENGGQIVDRCPSCGGKFLFIGSGGHLTCGNLTSCNEPGVSASIEALRARVAVLEQAATRYVHSHAGQVVRFQDAALAGEYEEAARVLDAALADASKEKP